VKWLNFVIKTVVYTPDRKCMKTLVKQVSFLYAYISVTVQRYCLTLFV